MKPYQDLLTKEKKEFWIKNPVKGEIDIIIDGLPAFKMFCENDDTVVKELYWTDYKDWELTSLTLWNNLLEEVDNLCVLDIGAYSGIYSLIAAKFDKIKFIIK